MIETPAGPVRPLDFAAVQSICDRLAPLGIVLRPQHGTLDQPTQALIAGTNRYALVRNGRVVHSSEFALGGIYLDPSGRCDLRSAETGGRVWVEEAIAAVAATEPRRPVDVAFGRDGRCRRSPPPPPVRRAGSATEHGRSPAA
jgi:hypothetical protein